MSQRTLRYSAFLSYSHVVDRPIATALRTGLHRFARPWNQLRALRVFRDESSLSANPRLWHSIENALRESEFFVLLACPQSAESTWVKRELESWRAERSLANLLIVLTDGEIVWDHTVGNFDRQRTTALPDILKDGFAAEPLYVDLRWSRSVDRLSLEDPRFRGAIADLAATLRARPKDELIGEDVLQHQRGRRIRRAAIAALVVLAMSLSIVSVSAYRQRNTAFIAQSRFLADMSRQSLEAGDTITAMLLALEGLPVSLSLVKRPLVGEAQAALYNAVLSHKQERVLAGHRNNITSIVFSADGKRILSASSDKTARVWDAKSGKPLAVFGEGEQSASLSNALFCQPDDQILTISGDGAVRFWNSNRKGPIKSFSIHMSEPEREPENRQDFGSSLASVLEDIGKSTPAWMTTVGRRPLGEFDDLAAFVSSDCRTIAAKWLMEPTTLWDTTTGQRLRSVGIAEDWPLAVVLDGTSPRLITRTSDSQTQIWDLHTGYRIAKIGPLEHGSKSLRETFQQMLRSLDDGNPALLTSVTVDLANFEDVKTPFSAAAITQDKQLLGSSANEVARLTDVRTGKEKATLHGHDGIIFFMDFSADGQRLLTASIDGTVRVWDVETGKVVYVLRHGKPVLQARFSHNAAMIVTVGGGDARLWDAHTGRQTATFRQQSGSITEAVFDPEDHTVLTGSTTGEITVWTTRPAYERLTVALQGHENTIIHASFSPDGRRVVTASSDGTARIWDVDAGKMLLQLIVDGGGKAPQTAAETTSIHNAELTSDGKKLVILAERGEKREVSLWDTQTRSLIRRVDSEHLDIDYAGLASDRRTIITTGPNLNSISAFDLEMANPTPKVIPTFPVLLGDQLAVTPLHDFAALVRAPRRVGETASVEIINILRSRGRTLPVGTVPLPPGSAQDNWIEKDALFLTVSDDGDSVLVGLLNGSLHLFTGCQSLWGWRKKHRLLAGHTEIVRHAAFGSDGRLVTSSRDGTSRVWNYRTGLPVAVLPDTAIDGVFSPDGKRLVTTRGELWDIAMLVKLGSLSVPWLSRLGGDEIDSDWHFAWSPDSSRIVAYGQDKHAYLFSVYTHGQLVARARWLTRDRALTVQQRTRYFLK